METYIPPSPMAASGIDIPLTFRQLLRRHASLFWIVLAAYILVFGWMFRDLLLSLPAIWRGDLAVSTDEIYPFFDWKTQIWDIVNQDISVLTNSSEFRFRYFFLTTWLRFHTIIPLSIAFSAVVTAYATFIASGFFATRFHNENNDSRALLAGIACSTLFIYLLLWYAKITNFYTLIVGFSMFSISIVLFMHGLFFASKKKWLYFIAGSLLASFNPAVHYVVMFALFALASCIAGLALRANFGDTETRSARTDLIVILTGAVSVLFFTLIPYALFAKFFVLRGVGVLQDAVPADYFIMKQGSLPVLQQLAFESTAVTNAYFFGRYLLERPRFLQYTYFFMALLALLSSVRTTLSFNRKAGKILGVLAILFVMTIWMSAGIMEPSWFPSLPAIIALVARWLLLAQSSVADWGIRGLYTVMSVLRYPNRFQLGTYFIAIFFIGIGYAYCHEIFMRIARRWKIRISYTGATGILAVTFFLPLLSDPAYRLAFTSGNMGYFLEPYPTARLKEIKDTLDSLPEGPLLMLPNAEGPKRIVDMNGVSHRLIDKFFIFYLGKPSYYFTNLGSIYNKQKIYMMLRSMSEGKSWWVNIFRNMGIRYLIVNKEISATLPGTTDVFANFESILQYELDKLPEFFSKKAENDGFILYEFTDLQSPDAPPTFVSMEWQALEKILSDDLRFSVNRKLYLSPDIPPAGTGSALTILTDDDAKAALDLYGLRNLSSSFFKPDQAMIGLSYDASIIPSSRFTLYPYTINTLYSISRWNTLNMITKGIYDTLTSTFTGLPSTGTLRFKAAVRATGTYRLFIRATGSKNLLTLTLGNKKIRTLETDATKVVYQDRSQPYGIEADVTGYQRDVLSSLIPANIVPISGGFEYFDAGTVDLSEGSQWIYLTKEDTNPFIIEGLLLIKETENPLFIHGYAIKK